MHRNGEDISEQLPVEFKWTVRQTPRSEWACRHSEQHAEHTPVVLAPMPAQRQTPVTRAHWVIRPSDK
ncbi:transposase IS66 [Caballeronia calidae]|uniref:Transposase IS66 n=1 Tax=Caballeronia calidae TaxID=1777139 RepID=A0A158EG11_9BURK|nr:transposase IS66 [Caballeronia calidae]